MYEKIVNYYEEKLSINNMYFKENNKLWVFGIIIVIFTELLINCLISSLIENLWTKTILIIVGDIFLTTIALLIIYIFPIIKIYKGKVKEKTYLDLLGMLMNQESLSTYREIEIKEMEKYLKNECKLKKIDSINIILDMINQEIEEKYNKKRFLEYFNNTLLPLVILVLTVYFTNNNEQQLNKIIPLTIISIITIVIAGNFVYKLKNVNVTPANKKENLLELKRILLDIKIKWSLK